MSTAKEISGLSGLERRAIRQIKKRLLGFLGDDMVKFVLYGSRARGDFSEDSDIDIAMVIKDLSPKKKHRILELVAEIEMQAAAAFSVLVLSEEAFERLNQRERRIARDILEEGVAL